MAFALTNVGHRFVLNRALRKDLDHPDVRLLAAVYARGIVEDAAEFQDLIARRWVAETSEDAAAAKLRYERNPLENVSRVVFEYTTLCNLDCGHCRNGSVAAKVETRPERLRSVVDTMVPLGVTRFDFIGGEVTLFGKGWLDLVRYARDNGATHVSVITSGWFFGERNFLASGQRYPDDRAFLAALEAAGLTHVIVSLDGPAEVHDACRKTPGLYARARAGLSTIRAAGLKPRVSVTARDAYDALVPWLADLSRELYGFDEEDAVAASRLLGDESNYASELVDVGGLAGGPAKNLEDFSDAHLRCKNFFRPAPSLRVQASGEVALCPLIEGGEGYGNVHTRDFVDILNGLQGALLFRLHAEKRIGEYRQWLDPEIFGGKLDHACTARVALNMIALAMETRGSDPETVRTINREVAGKMGILPRPGIIRANGHSR